MDATPKRLEEFMEAFLSFRLATVEQVEHAALRVGVEVHHDEDAATVATVLDVSGKKGARDMDLLLRAALAWGYVSQDVGMARKMHKAHKVRGRRMTQKLGGS
ncbi:unnamed protein product [Symbiodinium sp. CCMP2592]|nr:unnamed protein product [Symbiodinium sp. CCMP2592]